VKSSAIDITETIASAKQELSSDKSLSPQIRALMQLLIAIVELLVNHRGLTSRNSSKAPSSDPNRPRGRKKRVEGLRRKLGGQPGHEGHHLEQVSEPDEVEVLEIDRRTLPKGRSYGASGYEKRQLIDIVVKRCVTEYRAEIVKDDLGSQWVAEFPEGVTRPAQYGSGIKAKAVYLSQAQLIPYERIEEYFQSQCGIRVSQGSLVNFNRQGFERLEVFEKKARENLTGGPVLHNDETGINVGGKLRWLHSASNEKWTLFFAHEKRGGEAMEAFGILPKYEGVSVHDHWKPYLNFDCAHAFCNAHHLRELERAWEQDGQKWAKNMKRLLQKMNVAVNAAGGKLSEKEAERYRKSYLRLVGRADQECPDPPTAEPRKRGRRKKNKARNLLERLRNHEADVLGFLSAVHE